MDAGPVLVVDDDKLIRTFLGDLLERAGCKVLTAESAEQAADALAQSPMLAFVDLNLPGAQGDAFCKSVRLHPTRWDLPVVMMTASEETDVVRRCFAAGADDFIVKPLRERQLLSKLSAVRAAPSAPIAPVARHKRVLVATERVFFGTLVGRLLERAGYTFLAAASLAEAESMTEVGPLALAIVDVAFPSAASLLSRLKCVAPPIPTLAVAAKGVRGPRELAELETYDVETEIEHLIRRVNKALVGSNRSDRRSAPRVPFHAVVQFRTWGDPDWLAGSSFDLSETGVYVRTLTPLPVSKPVEISFELGPTRALMEAKGIVVWSNAFGPRTVYSYPYGMGVTFSDFPVAEWTKLREYIQEQKAGG